MLKKLLIFFIFILSIPAYSGELENALKNNNYTMLYVYTPECGYCKRFNPVYEKLSEKYSGKCKFVKINGNTLYGYTLIRKYHISYVPYVMIFNNKASKAGLVATPCLLNYPCAEKSLNSFIKL